MQICIAYLFPHLRAVLYNCIAMNLLPLVSIVYMMPLTVTRIGELTSTLNDQFKAINKRLQYDFFSVEPAPAYGAHVTRTLVTRKVIVQSEPYSKANYHSPALLHMLLPNSVSASCHGNTTAFSLKAPLTE